MHCKPSSLIPRPPPIISSWNENAFSVSWACCLNAAHNLCYYKSIIVCSPGWRTLVTEFIFVNIGKLLHRPLPHHSPFSGKCCFIRITEMFTTDSECCTSTASSAVLSAFVVILFCSVEPFIFYFVYSLFCFQVLFLFYTFSFGCYMYCSRKHSVLILTPPPPPPSTLPVLTISFYCLSSFRRFSLGIHSKYCAQETNKINPKSRTHVYISQLILFFGIFSSLFGCHQWPMGKMVHKVSAWDRKVK